MKQERFFSNGEKPSEADNFLWKVPISIVTSSSYPKVHQEILLEKREDEVNLGVLGDNEAIKLNKNSVGLYRTNYSPEMLSKLSELVKSQKIHATDRLGLQSDIFALSKAGYISASEVLKFLEGYSSEDNVTVWKDLLMNLQDLSSLLLNTNFHQELQAFTRRLVKPTSKKLGWDPIEGESSLQAMCRATIIRALATNGDADTIAECKRKFEAHVSGSQPIVADLRAAVYAGCLYDGDDATVSKFIELHNKSDLQEEKMRLATALGSVRTEALIQRVLEFALSNDVRLQDAVTVICSVSGNTSCKLSSDLAWDFVKKNWDIIYKRYSSGFLITRLVKVYKFISKFYYFHLFKRFICDLKSVSENFATQEDYDDVDVNIYDLFYVF